jgi:CRISPR/Cas system CMR subunit Cmr6 (Cas7 group RAMP superfamily)
MSKENPFRKMGIPSEEQQKKQKEYIEKMKLEEERRREERELRAEAKKLIEERQIKTEQIRVRTNGENVVIIDIPFIYGPNGREPEGYIKVAQLNDVKEAVKKVAQRTADRITQWEDAKNMIIDELRSNKKLIIIHPSEIIHNVEEGEEKAYEFYKLKEEWYKARSEYLKEVYNQMKKLIDRIKGET